MRSFSVVVGHLLGVFVLILGILWMVTHIADMPDYKLIAVLAAMNILVLNHVRWWNFIKKSDNGNMSSKVNHIVVSSYMVLMLFYVMLDF